MRHTVYYIENQVNLKGYVGVTNGTPEKRFVGHVCDAKSGRTSSTIHKAIRKYGRENFTVRPLEVVSERERALELEVEWIAKLDTCHGPGYNDHEGGDEPPHPYGEDHHSSKLTKEDVWNMRKEYADDPSTSYDKLANKYDIDRSSVAAIISGNTWKSVPMPKGIEDSKRNTPVKKAHPGAKNGSAKLTSEKVRTIRVKYATGEVTQTALADKYGINQGHVTRIVTGKAWPEAGGPLKD